jgi:ABC-2 type transport system permease protein
MIRGILMQHIMQAVSKSAFSGSQARTNLKEALDQIGTARDLNPADRNELSNMLSGILKWQEYWESNQKRDGGSSSLPSGSMTTPFETKEETIAGASKNDKTAMHAHAFAGMAVQFVLFGAIEAGVGLLTERQRGLWKRLRAAPLSRLTLLGGRAISGAIIALLVLTVVFLCGTFMFGIRIQGSVIGFGLVTLAYALCAATFGLLIAALGKTPQAARGFSILVVLMMVLLGGAWMPTFLFPSWLQRITPIMPTRWAVDGLEGTLFRKFTLVEALGPAGALLGFAFVFALLTWVRFRWEAE